MNTYTEHELKTTFTEAAVKIIVRNMTQATVTFENLIVNRTTNNGNMQLIRTANGWDLWNHHEHGSKPSVTPHERLYKALYVGSRWNGEKFVEPTHATRGKIIEKLLPIAVQFLAANPELLRGAEEVRIKAAISEARDAIRTSQDAIAAQEKIIAGLTKQLREVVA